MVSSAASTVAAIWLSFLPPQPQPQTPAPPSPPAVEEHVDVIAVTPIHGLGVPIDKIPANVQAFTAADLDGAAGVDLPAMLAARAASLQISDAQAGTFQPDVVFRGFVASPLLGASEGLAVYLDGVRLNEPFGDTVHWDAIPSAAIASVNLIPGSNPLFGLNALGGALSMRTKDGFAFAGQRAAFTTGSFGRHHLEVESGGHAGRLGYFVSGALTREEGWRDVSPSRIRRVFSDLGWRGKDHALHASVTAASNRLTGNGTAPVGLLAEHRGAVFTHPDETDVDLALVTLRARRHASDRTLIQGVAYYRRGTIGTFNGDLADDDDDDGEEEEEDEDEFDAVNNISRSRARGAGVTAQLTRTGALLGRDHHLVAGGGIDTGATRFAFAREWADLTPARRTLGSGLFDEDAFIRLDSRTSTGSAFVTTTWSLGSGVTASAATRVNWTVVRLRDRIGTALTGDHEFWRANPSAGLTWTPGGGVNLFAGYSQASRVPTPVELTCADPEDPCRLPNAFVSDPPLNQVVAGTWEAGLRGHRAGGRWAITAFSTGVRDDIIFVSSGRLRGEGHFENIARTRRRGVEASFTIDVSDRVRAFAGYGWQRATFGTPLRVASPHHPLAVAGEIAVAPGDRLPGVPAHAAKAGVSVAFSDALEAGLNARAQSAQFLRGDEANLQPPLPGFVVVDARLRRQITSRLALVAHAQNLLDARFYTFGMLGDGALPGRPTDDPRFFSPGAPRAGWIGVTLGF
jgi:iron complex outermembrane recepter protein